MSTKKHLDSYKGRLSSKQIADGINAARQNALRLIKDSELLFKAGSYPTATALAVLSIEESGKDQILRRLATVISNDELLSLWKEYRSHTSKNIMWILPQLVLEGAQRLDDFRELFNPDAEHPYILEQIKQVSFYTDCLGKAHWSEPSMVIDKELAKMLLQIARVFIKDREMQVKEIELWIKHMSKVEYDDYIGQKEALMHWYAEMVELGLTPKESKFEDFVQWLGINFG